MRSTVVLTFAILILLLSAKMTLGYAQQPAIQDSETMFETMKEAGVTIQKYVLQQSGLLHKHQTEQQVNQMVQTLKKSFAIDMKPIESTQRHHFRFQGEKQLSAGTKLQIAWVAKQEQSDPSKNLYTTYLVIQIDGGEPESWKQHFTRLTAQIEQLGIRPQIKTSVQGFIPSVMSKDERTDFLEKMFGRLGAKVTEGVSLESVVSLSGISPKLNQTVTTTDGGINVQIAAHVNLRDETTVITIGNPVIIMEY